MDCSSGSNLSHSSGGKTFEPGTLKMLFCRIARFFPMTGSKLTQFYQLLPLARWCYFLCLPNIAFGARSPFGALSFGNKTAHFSYYSTSAATAIVVIFHYSIVWLMLDSWSETPPWACFRMDKWLVWKMRILSNLVWLKCLPLLK